jgi:hypothetical protein
MGSVKAKPATTAELASICIKSAAVASMGWRSLHEAAVLALHLDEGGHDGADAEGADVAAEDAAEQRRGHALKHLGPKWRRVKSAMLSSWAGMARGVRRRGRASADRRRWRRR